MATRAKLFSQLAKSVDASGTITSDGISSTVSLGATVYDSIGELPMSGYTAGEQAFVKSTSRLYINSGVGWYNVAVINNTPTIQSILDSDSGTGPFSLATDGTATTITITAQDSDGDALTYTASADSDFNGLATISQVSNVFTITPLSQDSATTSSGTITFNVTDNINIANSVQTFTLNFVSALWDETVLSIGTSSTNSLANSTFIDRSTNAHTITPTGTPIQTAFHPYLDKWSNYFYTNASYLSLTGGAVGSGDFTVEAWINLDNHHDYNVLYDTRATGTSSTGYAFGITSTGAVYLYTASGFRITTSTTIAVKTWHHVALVRSGSTISIWINGTQDANTYTSSATFSDTNTGIGQARTFTSSGQFQGYISNIRVVDGTAVYTSTFTPPTENLTAITNTVLLTCQNNRFIDNSSNEYALTVVGTPEVSAFNPFGQSEYVVGENKGSVRMIQTNTEFLVTPQLASLSSTLLANNFTIEAWVYLEEYASVGASHIWNNSEAHSDGQTALYIYSDGRIMFGKVGVNEIGSTAGTIKLNIWHHIAMVRNGATTRVYVNGADVANGASSTYLNTSNVKHMKIGRSSQNSGDNSFPGYISDFKVTPSAVYTSSFTAPTAPVGNTNASLYLPMDNAGIFDKTGNNTLTLTGNTATSTTQTKFADTAMYFDGTGDCIVIEDNELFDFGSVDFTIEGWFYQNATSNMGLFGKRETNTQYGTINLDVFGGYVRFLISTSNGGWVSTSATSFAPTINTWYHLALVRDTSASTLTLYANGNSVGQLTSFTSTIVNTTYPFIIGNSVENFTESPFNGYIENFQILKGVAKYTTNFTPSNRTQGRSYQAES